MIYTVKHTLITWATVGATPSFAVTADNLMFTGHITPTELPAEALLQHALAPIGFGTRPHMVTRVVGDVYCLVLISIVAALFLIDLYYFSPFPLPLLYLLPARPHPPRWAPLALEAAALPPRTDLRGPSPSIAWRC